MGHIFKVLCVSLIFLAASPRIHAAVLNGTVECSQDPATITLNPEDCKAIQTPGYPKSLSANDPCSFKFVGSTEVGNIYVVFTNGYASNIQSKPTAYEPKFYTSTNQVNAAKYDGQTENELSFGPSAEPWTAVQGFVFAQPKVPVDNCLHTGEVMLYDTSVVFPVYGIFSDFEEKKQCSWQITSADANYKVKVDISWIDLAADETVTIGIKDSENKTQVITEPSNSVSIIYHKEKGVANKGFVALVSLVPKAIADDPKPTPNQSQCLESNTTDSFTFGNFNPDTGYSINSECNKDVIYKADHIVNLRMDKAYLETGVDQVLVQASPINISMNRGDFINVETTEAVSVKFLSDWSVNQAGFQMIASYIPCECPENVTLSCTSTHHSLSFSDSYCSGLNCSYSLVLDPSCPRSALNVHAIGQFRNGSKDSFTLTANDVVVMTIDSSKNETIDKTINAGASVKVTFVSGPKTADHYPAPVFSLDITTSAVAQTTTTKSGETTTTSAASFGSGLSLMAVFAPFLALFVL